MNKKTKKKNSRRKWGFLSFFLLSSSLLLHLLASFGGRGAEAQGGVYIMGSTGSAVSLDASGDPNAAGGTDDAESSISGGGDTLNWESHGGPGNTDGSVSGNSGASGSGNPDGNTSGNPDASGPGNPDGNTSGNPDASGSGNPDGNTSGNPDASGSGNTPGKPPSGQDSSDSQAGNGSDTSSGSVQAASNSGSGSKPNGSSKKDTTAKGAKESDDMTPLSEETMAETMNDLGSQDIEKGKNDPYEAYYLYDFLYIGDSFIVRLERSGILHDSCKILAQSGSAARDWYVQEDNPDYVDYLERLQVLKELNFSGIVVNYGINDVKNSTNVKYSKQLIQDLRTAFPDTPIFILKIVPVAQHFTLKSGDEVLFTSEDINRGGKNNVETFNQAMERFSRTMENVFFVDATDGFVDKNGNLQASMADGRGLHIADPYVVGWCQNIFRAVTSR